MFLTLGVAKQDDVLKEHLETYYPLGKADLATACVLRCLEFCAMGGATALVTPQNWLFLRTYTKLRQMLLENRSWDAVARLGPGAFETIAGHVVNVALLMISAISPADGHTMVGIDVSGAKKPEEKAAMLLGEKPVEIAIVKQEDQPKNQDIRIIVEKATNISCKRMGEFVTISQGSSTGDDDRFTRGFWECSNRARWHFFMTSPKSGPFSGRSKSWDWPSDSCELSISSGARIQGLEALGKTGFAVAASGRIFVAPYHGDFYNKALASVIPRFPEYSPALLSFFESGDFEREVRKLDQKLRITPGTFKGVPFDLAHWQKVATEQYPNSLPEPESDDPTQWIFHGLPENSTAPLQVAVARLLGYRWPAELDPKMRLSQQARDLVKRCDGLLPFVDKDGIVCISPVRGEASASDRLLNLFAKAYGEDWNTDILNSLLKDVGFAGKTLEKWLRDGFFAQHCAMFRQRPFTWQIWDGLNDGFSVLVNYHKLDRKNLETLIYTYLGDWISRQKDEILSGVDGAQERLSAAEILKNRLQLILYGEAPYDIFVRWKPIEQQPAGGEPDLNDGVRVNIRPFLKVLDVKAKGAGILRVKPKIKWGKDRGKEPKRSITSYPWFWGWDGTVDFTGGPKFTGERFNDCHYTLDFKRLARENGES